MLTILSNFEPIILGIHVIICLFLIVVILLQAGKGADMGAAFGAGNSQTFFGARGAATFLQKMTTTAAICFLLTSISLTAINKNRSVSGGTSKSVVDSHTATSSGSGTGGTSGAEPVEAPKEVPVPETNSAPVENPKEEVPK